MHHGLHNRTMSVHARTADRARGILRCKTIAVYRGAKKILYVCEKNYFDTNTLITVQR